MKAVLFNYYENANDDDDIYENMYVENMMEC